MKSHRRFFIEQSYKQTRLERSKGGPGLFKGCDKAHDQSWTNYIVPLQLAAQKNLYKKQPDEVVHWVLYEPPYKKRWQDDSVITNKYSA